MALFFWEMKTAFLLEAKTPPYPIQVTTSEIFQNPFKQAQKHQSPRRKPHCFHLFTCAENVEQAKGASFYYKIVKQM